MMLTAVKFVRRVIHRNFSSTRKLPPDVVYKFHHINPFRKEIPRNSEDCKSTLTVGGASYSLLHKNPNPDKSNIYIFVFGESKRASDATCKLTNDAKLVPWNVILKDREKIREFVTVDDVLVFNRYVRIDVITAISNMIQSKLMEASQSSDVDEGAVRARLEMASSVLRNINDTAPQYLVNEERQLTSFLKHNLFLKLPPPLMVTDTNTLFSREDKHLRLCEYDRSKPDLCVFADHTTGLLITNEANGIDEFTVEGKRNEYAMGQCIANMVKLCTELTIMALSKGNIVDKTNIFGVVANYYEIIGSILSLEMNFSKESCIVCYSAERLPLTYCLNAACSALLPL